MVRVVFRSVAVLVAGASYEEDGVFERPFVRGSGGLLREEVSFDMVEELVQVRVCVRAFLLKPIPPRNNRR